MNKSELAEKYWFEYLTWCADMPTTTSDMFKWLTLKEPTEAHFWRWVVEIKKARIE
jgi:hypothetical protein